MGGHFRLKLGGQFDRFFQYITYNIFKSENNKNFVKQNDLPLINSKNTEIKEKQLLYFIDKKNEKGKTYYYQIVGQDYFGDETGKSEVKKLYVPYTVDAFPNIEHIIEDSTRRIVDIKITPSDSLINPSFTKIILFRSDSLHNFYIPIKEVVLKKTVLDYRFILDNYSSGDSYHYKVALISQDKDTVFSHPYYFFTLDQEPPGIVSKLSGKVDSLGIVTLSWLAPTDKDLKGYRIFRGNKKNDEFNEISKELKLQTFVNDTLGLNNLTSEIYYYVKVVDNNYNNSKHSDTLLLMKPDTIKPTSSVFKTYDVSQKGVYLKWFNSTSEDLKSQCIIKTYSASIDTIFRWSDTTSFFIDTNVLSGLSYKYELISFDQSKNFSKSPLLNVNFELGYRSAIQKFTATVNREQKLVLLNWEYDSNEVYSYQIYKAKGDGKFQLYKTVRVLDDFKNELSDKDLKINTTFKYKIKALLNSGLSTVMSQEISVDY